ncbi:MAG TPA: hypothetical protein VD908_03805 [Cytophagales bacterium]|nr:hypothetical protein [Cytophagales bacterium]
MYSSILTLHSLVRWLVLASLILAISRSFFGWKSADSFSYRDNILRQTTVSIVHLQFLLGITLYVISPIVAYFLDNFKDALHIREFRFFGIEHITTMTLSVAFITVGSAKSKRKTTDKEKFRTMAIWFTVALLLILFSIPWGLPFLVDRPYFRWF